MAGKPLAPPPPRSLTTDDGKMSDRFYQWLSGIQQSLAGTMDAAATEASAADYQGNVAGFKALTPETVWAAVADVALTDAASVVVDMGAGFNFTVSILGNRTLANPSNAKPGQSGVFKVTASGGTRTITVDTNYMKTADIAFPVSIASGQKAFIYYHVDDSTHINITAVLNNPT